MADLLARFKLVDEMSDRLSRMAASGQDALTKWEQAGDAVNSAPVSYTHLTLPTMATV